jgi:predicted ArsR family transcriptional regulator
MAQIGARRERLLEVLRAASAPRTVASLADELGVHVNTVRFHLEALRQTGQVEPAPVTRAGPGRPPARFQATRRMDPDGPTNYRLLAGVLAGHLVRSPDPAATAAELGRAWGPQLVGADAAGSSGSATPKRSAAVARLTGVLRDAGFDPEPPAGPRPAAIRLRNCPFLDLVAEAAAGRSDGVICALHLGLMQGALAALRAPVTVDRLEPFAEPDRCLAHLSPVPAGSRAERVRTRR